MTSPPPPRASAPPRVGDAGREGRTAAPPPEDKAARRGDGGERVRDGPHDRAQGKQAPCRPRRGGHRGSERRVGRAKTGATRRAPLPSRRTSAVPRASAVPATCLRRRKGNEGPPPPHPQHPHPPRKGARAARGSRGDMGDDGSGKRTPPPEGAAAGWGGRGARVRDKPHDRAHREHAPCRPQRGDHQGCNRRKGRVTAGATRRAPPPQRRDKCRASCLRRAYDVLAQLLPLLLHPPTKRAMTARRQRGDKGGGRKKKKKKKQATKDTNTPEQGQTAGADGAWRGPGGTARGAGQGDAPGDESEKAGTNTATNRGEPG